MSATLHVGIAGEAELTLDELAAQGLAALGREFAASRLAFVALGDEGRQRIFMELLANYGGLRVGELVNVVGLSRPTISHHLKILREAGLVDYYSVGTKNYYHVDSTSACW